MGAFDYDEAFSRNIGWITAWEQQRLRDKRVAIAGMGGVGGFHLVTLTRLGVGAFHTADFDTFELANFNRQTGASMATIGAPKAEVMAAQAHDINPELDVEIWRNGISESDIDAFLAGVDLYIDGLDFFVLDVRAKLFARCAALGIPAITAAPLGFSAAYLVFMPGHMTFEEYFRLEGQPLVRQYVNFFLGLAPAGLQQAYLVDPSRLDLPGKKGPSSVIGCHLCTAVTGAESLKILLRRGAVRPAPTYHQFDAFRGRWVARKMRGGNANPLQKLKLTAAYRFFERMAQGPAQ